MTVTALDVRNEYTGTASQTIFNYTFLIFTNQDLNVYITPSGQDADDAADLTTAYTVDPGTLGNPSGGFITLNSGVSAGDLVTIVSSIVEDRTTDYQNSGDFRPDTVNEDFDRVVSIAKQVDDRSGRTLAFPESLQNATSLTLPLPVAGSYVIWNPAETGLINAGAPGVVIPSEVNGTALNMIADASLVAGEYIITTGYGAAGDGGDNLYLSRAVTGGTDDGGSLIKSSGNVAIEFVGLFPQDIYNIKQWGALVDGVTDDTAFIQAALDYVPYRVMAPEGTILLDNATVLDIDGKRLQGQGMGKTILKMTATPANIKLQGDYGSLMDVSIIDYGFVSIQGGDQIRIEGVEVDNSGAVDYDTSRSAFKITSAAQLNGFQFIGNYIHDAAFAFFTASDFGSDIGGIFGYCHNSTFSENRVERTRKSGFAFNADGDAYTIPNNPWQRTAIVNNNFSDYAGDNSANRSIAIGCDWATGLLIDGNIIDGYGRAGSVGSDTAYNAAIHIEDASRNFVISNNMITDAEKGIEIYDTAVNVSITGNVLTGKEGHAYSDDVTTFAVPDVGYLTSSGISYVQSGASDDSKGHSITGNSIRNFRKGIVLADSPNGGVCTGNVIGLCSSGIQFGANGAAMGANDNTINHSRYVYSVENTDSSAGLIGVNSASNCDDIVYFIGAGNFLLTMRGIKWYYEQAAVINAATTPFDLFLLPDAMNVTVNTLITNQATTSQSSSNVLATWDGATLTSSKPYEALQGTTYVRISNTNPLINNTTRMDIRLFSAVGSNSTANVAIELNGFISYGQ